MKNYLKMKNWEQDLFLKIQAILEVVELKIKMNEIYNFEILYKKFWDINKIYQKKLLSI